MIKLKNLITESMFTKVVKALKDIKVRATIHLNDMIEDRLKKAGIQKGYNLPAGVDIMADSSDIGDKKYTKAQHDIRGGV